MIAPSRYAGKRAALATMHQKQEAIAPPLERLSGLRLVVPAGLDTDALGTFTGEIPRKGTIVEAALTKARLGMKATGLPLGIASEGAYGPHPIIPFAPCATEHLVFVDDERGITVTETIVTLETNYAHKEVASCDDAEDFLNRAGFPAHGVIVRPDKPTKRLLAKEPIYKDLGSEPALAAAIAASAERSSNRLARLETDMRAHRNPTRMKVIACVAEKLALRLATPCPRCDSPGFGFARREPGLPCSCCGAPTDMHKSVIEACLACKFEINKSPEHGKTEADPQYCSYCNP